MTINNDLLDQLLADYKKPEDILGENGLLKQLTKAVLERAMQAELTHHLGYPKHGHKGNNSGNSRNGKSKKTLKGDFGSLPLEVPRDRELPTISKSWRLNWGRLIPFMSYPAEIRRVIYTTNVIESVNSSLRKVLKNRGSFPNEDAVIKLVYLALRNISGKWSLPIRDWASAMNRFAIMFEGRMPID
jgi:transposase-like protein